MLRQYIRDKKNNPIGVMLAEAISGSMNIGWSFGWSLCNKKDKFDKKKGILIAENRLNIGTNKSIPSSIIAQYIDFATRAQNHFCKNDK